MSRSDRCGQICDCHWLAHEIDAIIARVEAPIPPPPKGWVLERLREVLDEWRDEHD